MTAPGGGLVPGTGDEADGPPWEPANEVERDLAAAVDGTDQQTFFRLIGSVDLYLPQFLADGPVGGPVGGPAAGSGDDQRFLTVNLFGHTFLPVFTSVEALLLGAGGLVDGYTVTNYPELRRKWPDPAWRLAVNPGTPIDAYVAIDAVAAVAVGDTTLPTVVEAMLDEAAAQGEDDDRGPYVDVDAALEAAAAAGDGEAYLRALAEALVIVPTAEPVDDASALLDGDFPWRVGGAPDAPSIDVFTSRALFQHSCPAGTPHVEAALAFFLTAWPDGHALSVNPGARAGVEIPADQVLALLFWAEEDEWERQMLDRPGRED